MIGERLEVPKPKPNGTAVQLEEDTLTVLTWAGYSPKTGRGHATKTTWRFKDADTQVVLIDVAVFSGTSWENGFPDPGRVVPDSHKRIARKYGRSRYTKQKFKCLILSEPARRRDKLGKSTGITDRIVEPIGSKTNELSSSLACELQAPNLVIHRSKQTPQYERASLRPDENPSDITKWIIGIASFLVGLGLALWANYNLLSCLMIAAYASLGATHGARCLLTRRHSRRS